MVESDDLDRLGIGKPARRGISDQPVTDRPQPEPMVKALRRFILLRMRAWYVWREQYHLMLAAHCDHMRAWVAAQLAKGDEE
jgi:hypothetical protein